MLYMVTFTINIPQMLAYIPYMDPMGYEIGFTNVTLCPFFSWNSGVLFGTNGCPGVM
jgi:hypothetical protein